MDWLALGETNTSKYPCQITTAHIDATDICHIWSGIFVLY